MYQTSFSSFWQALFSALHAQSLDTRWVRLADIEPLLYALPGSVRHEIIGHSAEKRPIYKLIAGTGARHVLAWAAMHGNESTALRGWMDLFLNLDNQEVQGHFGQLLSDFTLHFIPMLNPDGAERYTRRNALGIDMNRDARAWQTPEMQVLKHELDTIEPVLAFNLHDQRNIFAVKGKSATISFLAPAVDVERTVTGTRLKAMDLIGAGAESIEPFLSKQIGRYTDEYYPTAVGEYVQKRGIPIILIECGAAQNDPIRQMARLANPIILHAVLQQFTSVTDFNSSGYNAIPVNETNQVDILIKGIEIEIEGLKITADLALLAEDAVANGKFESTFKVLDFGDLQQLVALETFDWICTETAPNIQINALANLRLVTTKGVLQFENGFRI